MSTGFVKIDVQIPPRLAELIKNHERQVSELIPTVLAPYGARMEREVKQALSIGGRQKARPDKRYKRKKGPMVRPYQPSEPGQPPRLRTGALRGSIGFHVDNSYGNKISLVVGSIRSGSARDPVTGKANTYSEGVDYSKYLESIDRPYLTPIVEYYKPEIQRSLRAAITKLFKGA